MSYSPSDGVARSFSLAAASILSVVLMIFFVAVTFSHYVAVSIAESICIISEVTLSRGQYVGARVTVCLSLPSDFRRGLPHVRNIGCAIRRPTPLYPGKLIVGGCCRL